MKIKKILIFSGESESDFAFIDGQEIEIVKDMVFTLILWNPILIC